MKTIVMDQEIVSCITKYIPFCERFCVEIESSIVRLHSNSNLYACVKDPSGLSCNIYAGDSKETIDKYRSNINEKRWIEMLCSASNPVAIFYELGGEECNSSKMILGKKTLKMSEDDCVLMRRVSCESNRVAVFQSRKNYDNGIFEAFQKRSVLDLNSLDSKGIDIIYFKGCEKLIEKLLYGGCRKLTVYIPSSFDQNRILQSMRKLSDKAPYSNQLTCVLDDCYAPETKADLVVGASDAISGLHGNKLGFGLSNDSGIVNVYVGLNTTDHLIFDEGTNIFPWTMHYVTSVMSEMILHAISKKNYHIKRLFKINSRNFETETIIKED